MAVGADHFRDRYRHHISTLVLSRCHRGKQCFFTVARDDVHHAHIVSLRFVLG